MSQFLQTVLYLAERCLLLFFFLYIFSVKMELVIYLVYLVTLHCR